MSASPVDRTIATCPHCGYTGLLRHVLRWHGRRGENCCHPRDAFKHPHNAGLDIQAETVEQDWKLSNFRKNPVALWGHDSDQPIGIWKHLRVEGERLFGKLELAEKGTSEFIDIAGFFLFLRCGRRPRSRE